MRGPWYQRRHRLKLSLDSSRGCLTSRIDRIRRRRRVHKACRLNSTSYEHWRTFWSRKLVRLLAQLWTICLTISLTTVSWSETPGSRYLVCLPLELVPVSLCQVPGSRHLVFPPRDTWLRASRRSCIEAYACGPPGSWYFARPLARAQNTINE